MTETPTFSKEVLERYAGDNTWLDTTKAYIGDLEGGFHATPYRVKNKDGSEGNLTIGHGFEYINGKPVTEDMVLTEEESNKILEDKIMSIDSYFLENYPAYGDMTPNQKAGITSFAYNLGQYVVDDPGNKILRKAMLSGDINEIAKAMLLYYKGSNGKRNEGLVNRRNDEVELILKNKNRGFSYEY
jgi:GH24 family phage-related lysozyme (muramidase)